MDKMEPGAPSYDAKGRLHVSTGEKGLERLPQALKLVVIIMV